MGEGSSGYGPVPPADDDDEVAHPYWGRDQTMGSQRAEPTVPPRQPPPDSAPPWEPTYVPPRPPPPGSAPSWEPTYVAPRQQPPTRGPQPPPPPPPPPPTYVPPRQPRLGDISHQPPTFIARPGRGAASGQYQPPPPTYVQPPATPYDQQTQMSAGGPPPVVPPPAGPPPGSPQAGSDMVRYGPGVPESQAGMTAEQVWRTGRLPEPAKRPHRVRRIAGTLFTVLLLAAAAVVLFLRFHHAPFHTSGAAITAESTSGCTVNVTGKIDTNGAAGTVSYQWVFQPQSGAPQPQSQTVVSGQHQVFVTVAVEGQGHGSATQKVTLQVLSPDQASASKTISLSC